MSPPPSLVHGERSMNAKQCLSVGICGLGLKRGPHSIGTVNNRASDTEPLIKRGIRVV